mmetsp:Transcript_29292/g.54331  ORF Transcript_29292/g.54331 Transcript_29292/m.54331 type:complete len:211 (+) Transcript_29292:837-1469(+)
MAAIMSTESSNMVTAAVPNPEPRLRRSSNSMMASSQWALFSTGTDDPPGMHAWTESHPFLMPPQCFSISSRSGIDMDSSTTLGFFTWPDTPNSFVPLLFSFPNDENHDAPRRRMVGATATVSTFVTVEGQPNSPTPAGNGGFSRGLPCRPSRLSMRAVSSPQMYAPAPRCRYTSKSYPDPDAFRPILPAAYASWIASSRTTASLKYSPRM